MRLRGSVLKTLLTQRRTEASRLSSAVRKAGIATCACMLVVLWGCGGASKHTTSPHLSAGSAGTAYVDQEVATCMRRNGVTVLSSGELQVSKDVTNAKRKAGEKRCGFGEMANTVPPRRNVANKRLTEELPARKPQTTKRRARKPESFRGRLVAKVVACLHKNGVNVPPSDSRLLSSTSGIKTRSPQVKAAISKCRSESLTTASR
jgi:hypothetical protein